MRGAGRFALRSVDPAHDRQLNDLARRAQAIDEPLVVAGQKRIQIVQENDGIYFLYPDGQTGLMSQYCGDYVYGRRYYPGQWVRHNGGAAICINTTEESPDIYPVGEPFWRSGLDHDLTQPTSSFTDSAVYRGAEFIVPDGVAYQVLRYGIYVPTTASTQKYEIWDQQQALGAWNTRIVLPETSFAATGWNDVNQVDIWLEGETHRVWAGHISQVTPQSFSGNWNQVNGNAAPTTGNVQWYNNNSRIRFHYTDNDGTDRAASLQAVPVGAAMIVGGSEWTITSTSFGASDADFGITGPGRPAAGVKQFTFEYGSNANLEFMVIADHYAGDPNASGVALNANDDLVQNQNGYGIDVELQQIDASNDWEIFSLT